VNAAATRVAASTALSAGIRAGLSGVNLGSLAQVIAGALKVQTDRILLSTNAQLVATTTIAQSETRIADFALQNKGALSAPPSGTITTLAADIASTVSGGVAPSPAPPPPSNGTLIVSFDETVLPNLGAFGDSAPSIATPPAGGTGAALKLDRSGTQNFGGTFFNVASPIPFAENRKTVTARVYSTRANAVVYLKVEAADGVAIEVAATTGAANTWKTLTWVLSSVNPANSYSTVVFSADTDVVGSGAQTYWADEVTLADAPVASTCATTNEQCISFSESTVAALGFEGLLSATVVNDPVAGASNKVLRLVKGPSGQPWAGATVYTMGSVNPDPAVRSVLTIDTVGLNTSKIVTVRSYSGAPVGTKVTLKLEKGIDPGQNVAAETVTTVQNAWETLTFNFANLSTGVFSSSVVYNTVSIFPAFSIPGAIVPLTVDTNFYFDELKYAVAVAAPPPPPPPPAPGTSTSVVSFDESVLPNLGAFGDANPSIATAPTGGTGAALKLDRSGAENFGGTYFNAASPIPFTTDRKTVTARVYSTRANAVIYLKVEDAGGVATEVAATTGAANTWQTLTWVLDGVNPANSYSTVVFSADTNVAGSGAQTYWIDEVALESGGGSGGGGAGYSGLPITFDAAGVTYSFSPFEGARDAAVVPDPAGGPNMVGSVIRNPGGPWCGGVTVWTGANQSIAAIPFTASAKTMNMRVFSPAAGMRVRMKVESASDVTVTSETDALTVGTRREVLTFNFANPGLAPPVTGGPTAPLNVAQTYNKVTLFFNVAAAGEAWGGTYYFDDIAFGTPLTVAGPHQTTGLTKAFDRARPLPNPRRDAAKALRRFS